VVPAGDGAPPALPALIGGVAARATIVRIDHGASYRGTARAPYATTALDVYEATRPLARRKKIVLALLGVATMIASIGIALRH